MRLPAINPNWKGRKWWVVLLTGVYTVLVHVFPDIGKRVPPDLFEKFVEIGLAFIIAEGTADLAIRVGRAVAIAKGRASNESSTHISS